MKVSWPTAVVLVVFIVAWVVLAALKLQIPTWMLGLGSSVGAVILAVCEALVSGLTGGGAGVTKLPTATGGGNGPVPPAAARVFAAPLMFAAVLVSLALADEACVNGQPTPQTIADVTIGLNGAICVITTYATDIQAGKTEAVAVADSAIKCGVSIVQATGVLDAHRKAMVLEGYAVRPAADAGK